MVIFADDVKVNTSKRYLYLMTNSDITCKRSHGLIGPKKVKSCTDFCSLCQCDRFSIVFMN